MAADPEILEMLSSVELFAHLPDESLQAVAEAARDLTRRQGDVIIRKGGGAHALHLIISGEAEVSTDGVPVATLGPGEYFGEIAVVEEGRRTATVTAATDLRILAIDTVTFRRLVRSDPVLASALPPVITERLHDLDEKRES